MEIFFCEKKCFNRSPSVITKKICGSDTPGWENIHKKQAMRQIGLSLENKGFHHWSEREDKEKVLISVVKKK